MGLQGRQSGYRDQGLHQPAAILALQAVGGLMPTDESSLNHVEQEIPCALNVLA